MTFAQILRMVWIDQRITDGRSLNRADLMDAFGLGVVQASHDIRDYMEIHPGRLEFDRKRRFYQAAQGSISVYPESLRMQVGETVRMMIRYRLKESI